MTSNDAFLTCSGVIRIQTVGDCARTMQSVFPCESHDAAEGIDAFMMKRKPDFGATG